LSQKPRLAGLHALRLPIGKFRAATVEEAVRQAHALRRAWDLGALELRHRQARGLSALVSCAALHTLKLRFCDTVTDLSTLAGLAVLYMLNITSSEGVTDVSG